MKKRIALARLAAIGWTLLVLSVFYNGWFLVPYLALGVLYVIMIQDKCETFFDYASFTMAWLFIVTLMITVFWKEEYRQMPVKQVLRAD